MLGFGRKQAVLICPQRRWWLFSAAWFMCNSVLMKLMSSRVGEDSWCEGSGSCFKFAITSTKAQVAVDRWDKKPWSRSSTDLADFWAHFCLFLYCVCFPNELVPFKQPPQAHACCDYSNPTITTWRKRVFTSGLHCSHVLNHTGRHKKTSPLTSSACFRPVLSRNCSIRAWIQSPGPHSNSSYQKNTGRCRK